MLGRQLAVALGLAALAGTAVAEPQAAPLRGLAQRATPQAPVMAASAQAPFTASAVAHDQAQAAPAPAPAKRVRAARVSACRCGGQTPTEN